MSVTICSDCQGLWDPDHPHIHGEPITGEWSPNGEVFHTCAGSEGCMCVYYQDPPAHPKPAPNRRGVVVFEVTDAMVERGVEAMRDPHRGTGDHNAVRAVLTAALHWTQTPEGGTQHE